MASNSMPDPYQVGEHSSDGVSNHPVRVKKHTLIGVFGCILAVVGAGSYFYGVWNMHSLLLNGIDEVFYSYYTRYVYLVGFGMIFALLGFLLSIADVFRKRSHRLFPIVGLLSSGMVMAVMCYNLLS